MSNIYKNKKITRYQFKNYCEEIISCIDRGKISRQEGCYKIAGLMFRDEIDQDPTMEDVCLLAGELELPDYQNGFKKKWEVLKELVAKI